MKQYIIGILMVCNCVFVNAQSVGINTISPLGIIHIDGEEDNSASPTAIEVANDVFIDSNGNLGVGTLLPQAKLSIDNNGNAKALKIVDGFQKQGQILTSDAEGNAFWGYPIPSTGKIEAILKLGPQVIQPSLFTAIDNSRLVVRSDGYHVYEIRWHTYYSVTPPQIRMTATHIRLYKNNVFVDEYEAYQDLTIEGARVYPDGNERDAVTFFTSLATQAKKGDVLHLEVRPGITPGNLILENNVDVKTSKIIVKRLNIK